jgi:septum formation protein
MLDAAGVAYEVARPDVDEAEFKARLSDARDIAGELAAAKAQSIETDDWVIGSDSVVSAGGHVFDKPCDREQAAEHLRFFSGKDMLLTSAVALARHRRLDWRHVETAKLQVRQLSERFIDEYLDAEWPEVGYTVGVFRLEGRGVQLFDLIEGDHFTILGMPLVPLLSALRERGLLLS